MVHIFNAIYYFLLIQQKNCANLKVESVIFINTNFQIQEWTTLFHETLCLRVLIIRRHEIPCFMAHDDQKIIKKQCISTEHCQNMSIEIISAICKIFFLNLAILPLTSKVVFK